VLRFPFSLDDLPAELVTTETSAYYRLDGTLRLDQGPERIFEEAGVALVEVAVWLCHWWTSNQPAQSYTPDGADPDYGPMLLLAPAGGTHSRLTYTWGDTLSTCTAEQGEWRHAVRQFRADLRQIVWERYHVRLDRLLPAL
jgi:hypothetical protein